MKKTLLASLILVGSLGAASAQASDAVVGAVVGGGVGGLIGHSVGGNNGAVLGGIVGALAGAAIADNSGPRYVNTGYRAPARYAPRPAPVYHAAPPVHRPAVRHVHHVPHQPAWNHGHPRHWR